jgi:hypothetical protein
MMRRLEFPATLAVLAAPYTWQPSQRNGMTRTRSPISRATCILGGSSRSLHSIPPEEKWGSWKYFVALAQEKKAIALKRYSYVSLFGQNSLSELRSSIFEAMEDVGQVNAPFDPLSMSSLLNKGKIAAPWLFNHTRKFIPWLKEAPDVTASFKDWAKSRLES